MNDKNLKIPDNLVTYEMTREIVPKIDEIINKIMCSLSVEQYKYDINKTINIISKELISYGENVPRVVYSSTSRYLSKIESEEIENIQNNVLSLLERLQYNDSMPEKCSDIIVGIYDSVQMFQNQLNKFNEIYKNIESFKKEFGEVKKDIELFKKEFDYIKNHVRDMQKEYISILGIFSAVVLIFVSSLLFTNGAIQNIMEINTLRLISVLDAIAMFLININYFMFKFIWLLQKRGNDNFIKIKYVNIILATILILALIIELFSR